MKKGKQAILLTLLFFFGCKKEPILEEYRSLAGKWKLSSARLNNKDFKNESLNKYVIIKFPNCKLSNKNLKNTTIKCLSNVEDITGISLDQSYRLSNGGNIDFGYFSADFGGKKDDIISKIIIGEWKYKITGTELVLTRNILRSDDLNGLVLTYLKQ